MSQSFDVSLVKRAYEEGVTARVPADGEL